MAVVEEKQAEKKSDDRESCLDVLNKDIQCQKFKDHFTEHGSYNYFNSKKVLIKWVWEPEE